ncbi:MAG: ABC transporter permease subunit [Treponema sp.]|jgi:NitT/TauT family transport system permease protein|nr:ABC transporter permease subunit [Treponema sp.]
MVRSGPKRKAAPAGRGFWFCLGILALLLFWELAALAAGSLLILPGPVPVFKRFLLLFGDGAFLQALGGSFRRVMLGIALSAPLGMLAGTAAALDRRAGAFLAPLFQAVAATPVMSVILIAFLVLGQERTPVFTAFLMVFPVMAVNTAAGLKELDGDLKELFAVYRLSRLETLRFLYIPSVLPFILGGLRSSVSLCWKVVVAAEVLVQPIRALGTGMQNAKAQLETAELFAWTAAAVIAAALSQLLLNLAEGAYRRRTRE